MTSGGSFFVLYSPVPDPIPRGEIFALEITVFEPDRRSPAIGELALRIRGWMPEHEHGMNLVPEVRSLGGSRFGVAGMLFHMPGRWQLEIEVHRGVSAEKATFAVVVE